MAFHLIGVLQQNQMLSLAVLVATPPPPLIFSGMFSARVSSCSGVDLSCVKSNSRTNYHTDPDSFDSPHPEEVSHTMFIGKYIMQSNAPDNSTKCIFYQIVQQRVKNGGFSHDMRWPQSPAQEESRFGREDHTQDKIRHRVGKTLPATASEEHGNVFKTGKSCETLTNTIDRFFASLLFLIGNCDHKK